MEAYKKEIFRFRSDVTKNCSISLEARNVPDGRHWKCDDDSMLVRVSFTYNGEEWATYTYRNWRLRREWYTDEEFNFAEDIAMKIDFEECLTDSGRKRPPTDKQAAVRGEVYKQLTSLRPGYLKEKIQEFDDEARLFVFGEENPAEQRIANLEQQLAEAKAKIETTSIESIIMKNVVDALTPSICERIRERVGALAGAVPTELTVKIAETIQHLPAEVRHHQFEKILAATVAGEALWLKGDAGTGKSFICKQIAEALGAEYYCTGAIMDEYAGLKGFIDANGIKHGTEFTHALDAAEAGAEVVICFDEADGSVPEVMVAINNYLAGGVIECMGKSYEKLDNLHIFACGNTNGRGGSTMYTRQIIDEATLDRFAFIEVDYDESIELSVAGGNEELATFCRQLRKSADACGVQMLVTYRAIKRLAVLSEVWESKIEALKASVIRGLDKADLETITRDMDTRGVNNEWVSSLKQLKEMVA